MANLKVTESKFLKVKCSKCKNEQIIFEKAAGDVTCSVCKELLAKSTGGKAKLIAKVIKEL
ncbi:MAG: 30S ribosomal protein S27e [Candidatus Nanoarchaeia archaeon]|nr:30S ribosomal protein S27e [Candidatus Nanoarchaeia archaeon]